MVSLSQVQASNALISSIFPKRLVALFVGGTSGIGEVTLKRFAQYTNQPRAYFVGRSQDAAERIVAECKTLNPGGEFIFVKADVSLIRVVDEVCEEIKAKEKVLNLLFMSQGVMSMDRSKTSEHVHLLAALNYYSRIRFITNLLPLLQNAPTLRRVVNVGGGGLEGPLDVTDFPALRVPVPELRGHLITLVTFGIEAVAKTAPTVSFIHNYPGTVYTGLYRDMDAPPFDTSLSVPIEECGERHFYLTTSARFPPREGESTAVRLSDGIEVAAGTTGKIGTGIYSVGQTCESASSEVVELLAGLREKGMVEEVWGHTKGEFQRIAKLNAGDL
ncbi:uncharacterized protein LY89DRAFT_692431 [Mollisia scopiformis]|uniref:Uncharacterized protein n=1 Tax=Mollisia scopiformis TaxID=149040 RepID=A0A132B224_MOLSC|nr:uncharacterized protein LY89DRAFT_692431 [Mollisia scopiformis]KUJ06448.1 hypothetical protein LY89DRAFT_692431 [Mollisia scopiformis]